MLPQKNSPSKILMTADTIGGVWTYTIDLCSFLTNNNIHIALALMGAPLSRDQRILLCKLRNITIYESSFKLEWMDNPWDDIDESMSWLSGIKDEFKPDLVHLNTFCHGSLKWNVPVLITAHSDVFTWWKAVKNEDAPDSWREYYKRVYHGLMNADLITAPSGAMLEMLSDYYGPFYNAQVIYNGRQRKLYSPAAKKPFIISAGRLWDEAKNISLLARASSGIKWKVLIAGEEHHPHNGGKDFEVNNINFLGRLTPSELAAQLSHASIYVLPAKYEPFGLSALEAALSGCALVLGNIKSLREVWQDNALYIDTDDEEELKYTVNKLINDPGLLKLYAEKAFRHAQFFSSRNMGTSYLDSYKSLMITKSNKLMYHENNNVLSLSPVRLEPWKRTLPPRNSDRVIVTRGNS